MIRIRLQRRGRKKRPIHHIVVADKRAPRDGRIIEDIGRFKNIELKNELTLNEDRAIHWLLKGAQPSDTVRSILKKEGIMYKLHLIRWGKSEEEIEEALAEWHEARAAKEEEAPSRKERQQALLEAEEKEYQKQLKKKAEEAAREKAKQEALASEKEEETEEPEEAKAETTTEEGPEETPAEAAEEESTEAEVKEEAETSASDEEKEEVKAGEAEEETEVAEAAPEEETAEETEEEQKVKAETGASGEEESEKKNDQAQASGDAPVSTDMLAKEAIDHIEATPVDKLQGFVTDAEDRVTVRRAWENKQEEEGN